MSAQLRALLVPVHGNPRLVEVVSHWRDLLDDSDSPERVRTMGDAIGADWIEFVRTPLPDVAMIVDEEGWLREREVNATATGRLYPGFVVGDVLVMSDEDTPEGRDVVSLTDEHLALVCERLHIEVPS